MPSKISEQRIRQAAEQLVDYRWNQGDAGTATDAGRDMRDWQLGGTRVMRAAKKAVSKAKQVKRSKQETPEEKAQSLADKIKLADPKWSANVWNNYGKVRVYVSHNGKKQGYIDLSNGEADFSQVAGFYRNGLRNVASSDIQSPEKTLEELRSQFPWVGSKNELMEALTKEFGRTKAKDLLTHEPQKIAARLKAMEDKMDAEDASF